MSSAKSTFSLSQEPCRDCGYDMYIPIADLGGVATLGLYNDGRFPGRSVLGLNNHYDALERVPDELYQKFSMAGLVAVRAIADVTGAHPINYAILCNRVRHVHAHIIPRLLDLEPCPDDPPWNDTRSKFQMPPESVVELCTDIGKALKDHFGRQGVLHTLNVVDR